MSQRVRKIPSGIKRRSMTIPAPPEDAAPPAPQAGETQHAKQQVTRVTVELDCFDLLTGAAIFSLFGD